MNDPNADRTGGAVYLEWVSDLAAAEDVRKEKLEARGLAVITVSGTLVTLLFGLATLATKATSEYKLPADARGWLYIALVLFGVSAVFAILTNLPLAYRNVAPAGLKAAVSDDYWSDTEADAQQRVSATRVNILLWNRRVNTLKAFILVGAVAFQIAAIVFVSLAVYEILDAAPVA
jgi:hypothetical protein